jgi:hypothetical protein
MNIKKLIPVVGIALCAVLAVVLWNPLVQKLGGKPTLTYAQEMLKLTREQYNALSPDERQKLAESIQDGNLEEVWEEAEKATDLRFYNGEEAREVIYKDSFNFFKKTDPKFAQFLSEDHISREFPVKEIYTLHLFRFTDSKGRFVHLQIVTEKGTAQGDTFITPQTTISVTRYDFSISSSSTIPLSSLSNSDQFGNIRSIIENRLKKTVPEVWEEYVAAPSIDFIKAPRVPEDGRIEEVKDFRGGRHSDGESKGWFILASKKYQQTKRLCLSKN